MEQDLEYRQKIIQEYKQAVLPLLKYLPWMEKNAGKAASHNYQGQGLSKHTISFPVYDSNVLNFVREASNSALMNRNYSYVYSRNGIKTHDDERRLIAAAELKDWDVLCGILSKYVLSGMTKATVWGEAVQENIFVLVLRQMRKIIEYWDKDEKREKVPPKA